MSAFAGMTSFCLFFIIQVSVHAEKSESQKADHCVNNVGFDNPKIIIKKEYSLSNAEQFEAQRVKLSCYIYPKFAVIELDNGGKGALDISVRFKSIGQTTDDLCQKNFKGKQLSLHGGHFDGVANKYVFVGGPEPYGVINTLSIYDAFLGKIIFKTDFMESKQDKITYNIRSNGQKISLVYYRPLKFNCVPTQKNHTCWQNILKENHIQSNVKIFPADCSSAIKQLYKASGTFKYNELDPGFYQITTKVLIDDITKANIGYMGGNTYCKLKP
jgi:hypothetical protein